MTRVDFSELDAAGLNLQAVFSLAQLPAVDRKSQRPGLIMAAIYRTLLDEIRRENFQVLHQRIALTPVRKLWIAWKTWAFA